MSESKNDEWFVIKNLEQFVHSTRALVFNSFGNNEPVDANDLLLSVKDEDKKELDIILSYDESEIIVKEFLKKQINTKSNEIRYLLSDNAFVNLIESLNDRMVSNMLNNLVNKGLVETAYDSESNDFVFWVKNDDPSPNENKETETN